MTSAADCEESQLNKASSIALTIAVCSFRRYDRLRSLVSLLAKQYAHREDLEILLIDNSDDIDANARFREESVKSANIRILESAPPGLSRARNHALQECKGEFIAYIDDDAEPSADWADFLVRAFEQEPNVAIVGGPILPVWPREGRPTWIPKPLEACFTILDHGPVSRLLGSGEDVYGANMAFRVDVLRRAGGFPEQLGRIGKVSLLSNEELVAQNRIRGMGHDCYYEAHAVVYHVVHLDRLNKNWFSRRMAWQVVSEALCQDSLLDPDECLQSLSYNLESIGVPTSTFNRLFTYSNDPNLFHHQIAALVSLCRLALACSPLTAATKKTGDVMPSGEPIDLPPTNVWADRGPPDMYRPRASLKLDRGGVVFAEAVPQHDYLFDCYAKLPNTALIKRRFDPWAADDGGLQELFDFLRFGLTAAQDYDSSLCFLTIDHWLRDFVADEFIRLASSAKVPVYAMLHRVPTSFREMKHLHAIATRCLRSLIVLSPDIREDVMQKTRLTNVEFLPHHAVINNISTPDIYQVRNRLGIRDEDCVFSLVGEIREGKGLSLILDALDLLDEATRKQIFLLLGGKASGDVVRETKSAFSRLGIRSKLALYEILDRRQFAALSDTDYADFIRASDVGFLIHQGAQRFGMSGALPSYVSGGAILIATADSYAGRIVSHNRLGHVITSPSAPRLAQAIVAAIDDHRTRRLSGSIERYNQSIADATVVSRLAEILR